MVRRWAWLAVLVGGIVLFEIARRVLIETQNPNLIPSVLLLGASVAPAAFVAFVWSRRLPYGVDIGTIVVVALLGGLIGVLTAGFLEYDTLRRLGVLPLVAVAFIEEASKLIVPVVLLLVVRRHLHPVDGLLVGVASGAGFAALETMGYAFVTLLASQGNVGAVENVLFLRGLASPAAHMAWTGITASALWYAAARGWKGRAPLGFVVAFLVAVALHTAWDSAGKIQVYLVVAAISLGLLGWFAHRLSQVTVAPAVVAQVGRA
jgi:RsiW-degrading membrane proteinase PrsW (M82 family)